MPTYPFHRIAVTARAGFPEKERILGDLVQVLKKEGAEVFLDPTFCSVDGLKQEKGFEELKDFDLKKELGGDGTTLRAVRNLKDFRIPLLTVNRGNVGFLAECDIAEMSNVLPSLLRGEGIIEERLLLSCTIRRNEEEQSFGIALNEVVVSQSAIARLIELPTKV
ncbi:MAG: NAD(+)/NADH kinase, partial [Patescibacteria group bacterium]